MTSKSHLPARVSVMIRLSVFSPLARKISPLTKGCCFSKSSSSGLDSVTLADVYQTNFPSFLAASICLPRSSWLEARSVAHRKNTARNNALILSMTFRLMAPFSHEPSTNSSEPVRQRETFRSGNYSIRCAMSTWPLLMVMYHIVCKFWWERGNGEENGFHIWQRKEDLELVE